MPFLEVTLQTWQYNLANRKKLCLAKLKKNKKKLSKKNPEQTVSIPNIMCVEPEIPG